MDIEDNPLNIGDLHPYLRRIRQALVSGHLPGTESVERFTPRDREGNTLVRPVEDRGIPLEPRRGAVLVLLYEREGQPVVSLTKRTDLVEDHKGEISLPGGAVEPRDATLLDTARRETAEELGVGPGAYEVWGQLSPVYIPGSHFVITPFVAYAATPPSFAPDPFEVAEVLEAPLATLLDPATIHEEDWELRGKCVHVAFFQCGAHKVWGATARVLSQLMALLAT